MLQPNFAIPHETKPISTDFYAASKISFSVCDKIINIYYILSNSMDYQCILLLLLENGFLLLKLGIWDLRKSKNWKRIAGFWNSKLVCHLKIFSGMRHKTVYTHTSGKSKSCHKSYVNFTFDRCQFKAIPFVFFEAITTWNQTGGQV